MAGTILRLGTGTGDPGEIVHPVGSIGHSDDRRVDRNCPATLEALDIDTLVNPVIAAANGDNDSVPNRLGPRHRVEPNSAFVIDYSTRDIDLIGHDVGRRRSSLRGGG